MSEKQRFYNMTRPPRFRSLKVCKGLFLSWCKALRERIIYLFNYILYKLHILQRYSYRTNGEKVTPLPADFKFRSIETEYFRGVLFMKYITREEVDIDYFYRQNKDGSKKRTLTLKDECKSRLLFTSSNLIDVCIKVSDKWYQCDSLPVFKIAVLDPEVRPYDGSADTEKKNVEYTTQTFKVQALRNLRHQNLVGLTTPEEVSSPMLRYYYDFSCQEFLKSLGSLTLHDLLV